MYDGVALPEKIANAPTLFTGLELYYKAFLDLCTDRVAQFEGVGPITWKAVDYYCMRNEFSKEQTADCHYHISLMDKEFISISKRKAK